MCYTWFARSSQQYVPEATYKLAQCKEDGWGCAVNMQEAVALYKEAADGVSACMHASLFTQPLHTFEMHCRQYCVLADVRKHPSAAILPNSMFSWRLSIALNCTTYS